MLRRVAIIGTGVIGNVTLYLHLKLSLKVYIELRLRMMHFEVWKKFISPLLIVHIQKGVDASTVCITCVILPSQGSCPKLDLFKIKVNYKNKIERMLYVSGC